MTKIEVELTEDQLEKVEILKSRDISVGEAIDMLFNVQSGLLDGRSSYFEQKRAEIKDKKAALEEEEAQLNKQLETFNKLMDTGLDVEEKQAIVEHAYQQNDDFYDTLTESKGNISWIKDVFKF